MKLITINKSFLKKWALPKADPRIDKNERGKLLIAAGAPELAGVPILCATAAFRSGAGKVRIITDERISIQLGIAFPEAMVFGISENKSISENQKILFKAGNGIDTVLAGPGMQDVQHLKNIEDLLSESSSKKSYVFDAACLEFIKSGINHKKGHFIITPHHGEMAALLGISMEEVKKDPCAAANFAANKWNALVILKGAETCISEPGSSKMYHHRSNTISLATAGSGDVLAGILAGLICQGIDHLQAAAWAVHIHARAGKLLEKKYGPSGLIARELCDMIPVIKNKGLN